MSETQTIEQNEVAAPKTQTADEQVGMLEFIEAWEESVKDGTGVQGVADKTGLGKDSAQAKASKYRTADYKKVNKVDKDGKTVYRRAVDGPNGETETIVKDEAKKTKQGALVPIKIFALDNEGKKIETRPALPLSRMPRGGHSRLAGQVDEALALLARLQGRSDETSDSDKS